jgi:UDP-3-O-acyl N-acetylglucosamine deacetylase
MRVIGYRQQRTTERPAELQGVGFITGSAVRLRLLPAPADSGIVFRRVDLSGSPVIAARTANVTGTQRRTTLGLPNQSVTLVEHLLAALAGLRIDNCTVELDGPEPPGLDGSAAGFVQLLYQAGACLQSARRPIYTPTQPVILSANGATVALHPAAEPGLRASYILDYGLHAPIARQAFTFDVRPENFVNEVAACRTFLTEAEAHTLRDQGIGRHLQAADVIVFGEHGPIQNRLRFADEPARHKVLDLIGDLALCGFDLAGHVVAYRSGHAMNVELAARLAMSASAGASFFSVHGSSSRPANRRAA